MAAGHPEAFQEPAIEAHLQDLVAQVDGAHLLGIDCSEYPCAAVVAFAGADPHAEYEAFDALNDASPYAEHWGTVAMHTDDETDEIELMIQFLAFPVRLLEDREAVMAANKRQGFRYDELERAYAPDLERLREEHRVGK